MKWVQARSFIGFFLSSFALVAMACGGPTKGGGGVSVGTGLLPENPVGFAIELDQEDSPALAPTGAVRTRLEITAASLNLARLDVSLPETVPCDAIEAEFATNGTATANAPHLETASLPTTATRIPTACEFGELRFTGPYRIDLLNASSDPPLADLALPAGNYQRITLKVEDRDATGSESNSVLADYAMVLLGVFDAATTAVTNPVEFKLAYTFREDIRFEQAAAVSLAAEGNEDLVIRLPASEWFDGLPALLDTCLADPRTDLDDGQLLLEDSEDVTSGCREIEERIRNNFKAAGRLESRSKP